MDLPNPGIEPGSPALQLGSLPIELSGKPWNPLNLDSNLPLLFISPCPPTNDFISLWPVFPPSAEQGLSHPPWAGGQNVGLEPGYWS